MTSARTVTVRSVSVHEYAGEIGILARPVGSGEGRGEIKCEAVEVQRLLPMPKWRHEKSSYGVRLNSIFPRNKLREADA